MADIRHHVCKLCALTYITTRDTPYCLACERDQLHRVLQEVVDALAGYEQAIEQYDEASDRAVDDADLAGWADDAPVLAARMRWYAALAAAWLPLGQLPKLPPLIAGKEGEEDGTTGT
jgi:hypothetical protein